MFTYVSRVKVEFEVQVGSQLAHKRFGQGFNALHYRVLAKACKYACIDSPASTNLSLVSSAMAVIRSGLWFRRRARSSVTARECECIGITCERVGVIVCDYAGANGCRNSVKRT